MAAALRAQGGRWLMHRRPAHKHHGGLWEFPGGKVENGESPLSALVRELGEELGITVDAGSLYPAGFAQEWLPEAERWTVILLYSCEAWRGEPRALEPGSTIGWFRPDEIALLDRPPMDRQLCERLLADAAGGSAGR